MQCVVLAGGLGTRMRPWTEAIPKALIPVCGRPFADIQLCRLADQGVSDVVYSVGYLADQLVAFIGDGHRWGVTVRFLIEDETALLGTAGALRLAHDQGALAEEFFVLYGDSYLPLDFAPVRHAFFARRHPALMTVLRNNGHWDRSNAAFRDGMVVRYEKGLTSPLPPEMVFIDYGLSIVTRQVIEESIPPGERSDLSDLFQQLSASGRLAGLEVHDRFYEVGSPQGLRDLEEYLSARARQS